MDQQKLETTAKQLVAPGKGILAADESAPTCEKRFKAVGVECNEENRRQYRQLLVTAPASAQVLSGIIFYDETFWQSTNDQKLFREVAAAQGVLPGIKVDLGLVDLPGFPGEKISRGLDDLPERIGKYAQNGARFAKWRSLITIGEGIPTDECIEANAFVLARYARICQDAGVVPIVEPEVLLEGTHTIDKCEEVMAHTLDILFKAMTAYRVHIPGAILKTSMVLAGKDSGVAMDHNDVAERTSRVLHDHVPKELGGVVFLSGGQTPDDAFINLNRIAKKGPHPWGVTFSYSRALQDPVLKAWAKAIDGDPTQIFADQLQKASQASQGQFVETQGGDTFVSQSQDT
jgi:fructose-bisphosphate aldolase, class I